MSALWGPKLSIERCNLCGLCALACPQHSLVIVKCGPVLENPEACDGCGNCEEACSEGAIDCEFTIVWGDAPTDMDRQEPGGNTSA